MNQTQTVTIDTLATRFPMAALDMVRLLASGDYLPAYAWNRSDDRSKENLGTLTVFQRPGEKSAKPWKVSALWLWHNGGSDGDGREYASRDEAVAEGMAWAREMGFTLCTAEEPAAATQLGARSPAWSARCDCRNGHASASGRCNARNVTDPTHAEGEIALCEDCRANCQKPAAKPVPAPLAALHHHTTGAVERGEKEAIAGIPAAPKQPHPLTIEPARTNFLRELVCLHIRGSGPVGFRSIVAYVKEQHPSDCLAHEVSSAVNWLLAREFAEIYDDGHSFNCGPVEPPHDTTGRIDFVAIERTDAPTSAPRKTVQWAYPSSTHAARFGYAKTGCWVLEIIPYDVKEGRQPPVALAGFEKRHTALAVAQYIPLEWCPAFVLHHPADVLPCALQVPPMVPAGIPNFERLLAMLEEFMEGSTLIHFSTLTSDGTNENETLADLIRACRQEIPLA